nr:flagellar assembly protein FliW [Paenibacillus bovis]
MKIQTKYHGEVEIVEDTILIFEKGIPGFPDEKKFTLLPLPDLTNMSVMQSVTTPALALVVADPYTLFSPYEFALDDNTVEELEIAGPEDVSALVILTVQDPFEKSTANLQAPIVMNMKKNKGKQVILNNENYKTKQPLFGQPVKG